MGLRGLVPQPLPRKPSFTLADTAARPFAFVPRTRGELTYLYFGYTHCRDACPTTMSDLAAALRREPARVRKHVEVVFVTVDPRRDTGPVLIAGKARRIGVFRGAKGKRFVLYLAPTHAGGYCWIFERNMGSCRNPGHRSVHGAPHAIVAEWGVGQHRG
jgi:hypothetical protein